MKSPSRCETTSIFRVVAFFEFVRLWNCFQVYSDWVLSQQYRPANLRITSSFFKSSRVTQVFRVTYRVPSDVIQVPEPFERVKGPVRESSPVPFVLKRGAEIDFFYLGKSSGILFVYSRTCIFQEVFIVFWIWYPVQHCANKSQVVVSLKPSTPYPRISFSSCI